ncbi:hypothetical protein DSO57_1037459 [Entomophthora muscae]|uniref:Uncharacterized protein n=1 Tax=Entomophthora muscae TaxID=34485 RepID=A0ACC2SZ29_9FUNG|nr:hypothetical protein DSO57_1037459 [Entomophthora muscae]
MQVSRGQVDGHGCILGADQVASLYSFGAFSNFNLPEEDPQVLYLFTAADFLQLSPIQKKDVLELLDQFNNIFASGPNDYGLAKEVIHQIDTGDAPPFHAKPYCRSRVEYAQVFKGTQTTIRCWTLSVKTACLTRQQGSK